MSITPNTAALLHFFLIFFVGMLPIYARLRHHHFDYLISIGAGVLLSAAFLHMLPSAIGLLGEKAGLYVLLGFLGIFLLEHVTMAHACGEEVCPNHRMGYATFFGLSVHSIISGLALGIGLRANVSTPVAIAMLAGVLVHKVPETLALVVLLLRAHWSKPKTFLFNTLYACMGPLGIYLGSSSVGYFSSPGRPLGVAIAISCGTFLYIASSDLLPHLHKKEEGKWLHLLAFLAGLLMLSFEFGGNS